MPSLTNNHRSYNFLVSSEITYPINLLTGTGASDHLIFFLDYPCQASGLESTCLKQCQNLGMETGKCSTSISPNACICKASSATALTLNSSVINHYDTVDPNGRNRAGEFVTERKSLVHCFVLSCKSLALEVND